MTDHLRENAVPTAPTGPVVELHLSRKVYATGARLSGVVVFRLPRPTGIRSLSVSVTGCETPAGASLARRLRRKGSFFYREIVLSGRAQPRRTSERASAFWNAFLGRDRGRVLSAGEHTYPFAITLPASLPPSYSGKAGKIDYRVTARVRFPMRRSIADSIDVPVVLIPRIHKYRPVALSYPSTPGAVHSSETTVSLELPHRTVRMGEPIHGRFLINNPERTAIPRVTVALETCEWVRLAAEKEMQRETVDKWTLAPEDPQAEAIESEFDLTVPDTAAPTIEGTAISVIWLLKLSVQTTPPLELKTPITVYAPLPER